jgi:predicted deacylase
VDLQTAESYAAGMLFVEAARRLDLPAVLVESHPGAFQPREATEVCTGVILRTMAHLGMLAGVPTAADPGSPRPAREAPPVFRRAQAATELRCGTGGYLAPRRWPGEHVRAGEAVAVVRSLESFAVAEELVSPLSGAVACVGPPDSGGLVKAGDLAAVVKPIRS